MKSVVVPSRALLTFVFLIASFRAVACKDTARQPTRQRDSRARPAPLTLAEIDERLTPYDLSPGRSDVALRALAETLSRSERGGDAVSSEHRWRFVQASIDLWVKARVLELLNLRTPNKDTAAEASGWLALLLSSFPPTTSLSPAPPPKERFARQLLGVFRPFLRDAERSPQARTSVWMLELLQQRDPALSLRAAARIREQTVDPSNPMAPLAYALLAAEALEAILELPRRPIHQRPLHLAKATGQFCRDGVLAVDDARSADEALQILRRRCGFACTKIVAPGTTLSRAQRQPLEPEKHERCGPEHLHLLPSTRGHYLGVDNFLATSALFELQEIHRTLHAFPETPQQRLVAPLLDALDSALNDLVLIGHLPFFSDTGAEALTLPEVYQARQILRPTRAVLILKKKELRLAAWPRFVLRDGHVQVPGDELHGYPGVQIAKRLRKRRRWRRGASKALHEQLEGVRALPWPEPLAEDSPPPSHITLIADASVDLSMLRATAALLRDEGFTHLQIAAWPKGDTPYLRRPVVAGVTLRIDRPQDAFTSRLHIADGSTYLLDPQGRRHREVALLDVDRYIPDIYAVVESYHRQNPALDGLILDPDYHLNIRTFVHLLDALRFARQGDVMASTHRLLEARPQQEGPAGELIPLMTPLFLAL